MRSCSAVVPAEFARIVARNGEAERAAFAEFRVDADLATVALDDALGQIQSVARSTAARFIQLQAEIENLSGVSRVDPNSVVADAEAVAVPIRCAFDGDRPFTLRSIVEEQGVGDQSADRLAHLLRI